MQTNSEQVIAEASQLLNDKKISAKEYTKVLQDIMGYFFRTQGEGSLLAVIEQERVKP